MMEKDKMQESFRNFNFDTEEPLEGHELRFLQKISENKKQQSGRSRIRYMNIFAPVMTIAASFLVVFMLSGQIFQNEKSGELASVSVEMEKTQDFYTSVIGSEIAKLNASKSPKNQMIINDAMKQLDILEQNFEKLKKDLVQSGNDERVIYAMISNYQQRLEILQNVMKEIKQINNLKTQKNENYVL